jgi:hypothetical protein
MASLFSIDRQTRVFCMQLFSDDKSSFTDGFDDWAHGTERIACHENSAKHIEVMQAFKQMAEIKCTVDLELIHQMDNEMEYLNKLLQ